MGIFGDILGSIIAGGAQVAGAAADRKYNERMTREAWGREDTQLQRLMKDASAAGIHPVAALGAAANYGSTQPMQPSGLGDAVGNAALRISETVARRQERLQDLELERSRLANEKLFYESQIRAQQLAEAQSRSFMSAAVSGLRAPSSAIVDAPTEAVLGGNAFEIGAAGPYTPAQVAEDAYGEVGDLAFGAWNFFRDLGTNVQNALWRRFAGGQAYPGFSLPVIFGNPRFGELVDPATVTGVEIGVDNPMRGDRFIE